jgi:hypothetical protein
MFLVLAAAGRLAVAMHLVTKDALIDIDRFSIVLGACKHKRLIQRCKKVQIFLGVILGVRC